MGKKPHPPPPPPPPPKKKKNLPRPTILEFLAESLLKHLKPDKGNLSSVAIIIKVVNNLWALTSLAGPLSIKSVKCCFSIFRHRNTSFYRNFDRRSHKIQNMQFHMYSGLQIRVCIGKLFTLFLMQNICCRYSKEPSQ